MKVAIIGTIASSIYGFRSDLIKALVSQDHQVYAFFSERSFEDVKKIEALGAIPVVYTINRGGINPLHDVKATLELTKKLKRIKPDIVFSFAAKAVVFGTLAAKLARIPKIVGMIEGLGYTFTEQPLGSNIKTNLIKRAQILLYKVALPQLDKLIFLNPDDPKDLLYRYSIKVNKVEVLGGIGLNLEDYNYSNVYPITPTFIFIARLLAEKGIHDYIAAARIVKESYPNTKFIVLGAIDEQSLGALKDSELNKYVESNIIEHHGHVYNVSEWIAKSSVFVLPSYYREGVPRSTQEAMAIGRAVITTDVPGCRETVVNGVNGFLVEKWNPEAIAEKMIYFIENPEQIAIMGNESYKIAQEKFDAEKVNQRLLKMIGI